MRRKIAIGNWKMHGLSPQLGEAEALSEQHPDPACEIVLCPPATLISRMWELLIGSAISLGGQDCHPAGEGAHTGDISAAMLADAGAEYVILGHSERRRDHGETNEQVAAKATSAHAAGLLSVICLGETEAERDAGRTIEVVGDQLSGSLPEGASATNTVIAYEPVWAIGTGRTPTRDQIAEVHETLRARLVERLGDEGDGMRLLYGGSVKAGNAREIFGIPQVDGALVGGASLRSAEFSPIIEALEAASA